MLMLEEWPSRTSPDFERRRYRQCDGLAEGALTAEKNRLLLNHPSTILLRGTP